MTWSYTPVWARGGLGWLIAFFGLVIDLVLYMTHQLDGTQALLFGLAFLSVLL